MNNKQISEQIDAIASKLPRDATEFALAQRYHPNIFTTHPFFQRILEARQELEKLRDRLAS